jgi:hypothetical protein
MLEEAVSDFFWVALFIANTLHTAAAAAATVAAAAAVAGVCKGPCTGAQ